MTELTNFADVETSSADYASRFSGQAGEWLLSVQSQIFLKLLKPYTDIGCTLLDVGGGHGQIAKALSDAGLFDKVKTTVLGSTNECDLQIRSLVAQQKCTFEVGNLLNLPYRDKSFDIVSCFRFVPHCPEWPKLFKELCRVAKSAVIIDYPTTQSINALTPLFFGWKKKLEGNTRTYDLFSHSQIKDELNNCGYSKTTKIGEFFWPMVLHRKLKMPLISNLLELPFSLSGITNILGSPVILKAEPKEIPPCGSG